MKRLKRFVTVNSGELKGKRGQLVSYDRNKWYGVKFDDIEEVVEFKLYYLDQEIPLKNNQRYLLPEFHDRYHTNKELWDSYKKDKSRKSRYYNIILYDNHESFGDLNFQQLLSKIRFCIVNKQSFFVRAVQHYKNGNLTIFTALEYSGEEDMYDIPYYTSRSTHVTSTFERGIQKLFDKY